MFFLNLQVSSPIFSRNFCLGLSGPCADFCMSLGEFFSTGSFINTLYMNKALLNKLGTNELFHVWLYCLCGSLLMLYMFFLVWKSCFLQAFCCSLSLNYAHLNSNSVPFFNQAFGIEWKKPESFSTSNKACNFMNYMNKPKKIICYFPWVMIVIWD